MSANDLRIAAIMASVAEALDRAGSTEETLERITWCSRETISGSSSASITVRQPEGHLETLASTGVHSPADALQYELQQGPCYEVANTEEAVVSENLSTDPRWPQYGPRAAALGFGAQLAVVFYDNSSSRGSLNVYFREARPRLTRQLPLAQLFARHAAIALGHSYTVQGLNQALVSRKIIGQALGIVMERYGLDEDRAFEFLMRVSQNGNVKLRTVAARIVHTANSAAAD